VNLASGTATGQGSDILISIEDATGSALADSITGNDVANAIKGEGGDETRSSAAATPIVSGVATGPTG
jgi:hypothetical protein